MIKNLFSRRTIFFNLSLLLALGFNSKAQIYNGYTLVAVQNTTTATLLDTVSGTFHSWTLTGSTGYSSYVLPGGTLLRTVKYTPNSFAGGGQTGKVQKVDYNGTLIWDYVYSTSTYSMHHDICPMPNGNVLLISYESKTAAEATAAGSTQSIVMWPEKIVEVQPTGLNTGNVVWEWHVWDHLVQNADVSKNNYQASISDHPELLNINYKTTKDWMHMNGIDYNPILDQIAVSSHNLNEIYVIDHSTTTEEAASHSGGNSNKGGDFLYRWGNPAAYGVSGTQILKVVHDAHWIKEGSPNAGRLVGFNNQGVSASKSAVDQIVPPINGYTYDKSSGSAFSPSTYTERHSCNGYSSNMGSSQQLPNGNMLVCIATAGLIYEVNTKGAVVWSKTATGSVPQASKYSKCYLDNSAPAIPTISQNNSNLISSDATTYQWYKNGVLINGAISKSFTPSENGIYLVRITDSKGCAYQYSKGFKYSVITSVSDIQAFDKLNIYPNPTNGIIKIDERSVDGIDYEITLSNALGSTLLTNKNVSSIDLSNCNNGLYFITVSSSKGRITKKLLLNK